MKWNAAMYAAIPRQRRLPYLPEKQIREVRDARLRETVQYAALTVPFYRDWFRREGVSPQQIRTLADVARLPVVEKEMVRAQPELFRSTSPLGRRAEPFITSGSSGLRATIFHDPRSLLANLAYGERLRAAIAHFTGGAVGKREAWIGYRGSMTGDMWAFQRRWAIVPVRYDRLFLSILDPLEDLIRAVNSYRPNVIFGFGAYLEMLFKVVAERKLSLHLPQLIVYGSEAMTLEGRRFIEERFGVPVLSDYGAVESFKIGFLCEARTTFHLHEDLCAVRIVDERDRELPEGESGAMLISNLVNRGTVLLNYRLGDVAGISSSDCPCGRRLPLLSTFGGRANDDLFVPDGRFIHFTAIWMVLKTCPDVLSHQLVQHETGRFELRLVTVDRATFDSVAAETARRVEGVLGKGTSVEPTFHERILPGIGGKFRPVVALPRAE